MFIQHSLATQFRYLDLAGTVWTSKMKNEDNCASIYVKNNCKNSKSGSENKDW